MTHTVRYTVAGAMLFVAVLGACTADATGPDTHAETAGSTWPAAAAVSPPFPVSGGATLFSATGIVHTEEPTASGLIQQSTTAGQLSGDLNGSVLFNATSVFDFASGTLVNTGTQFFSGTVAGSGPVILYDDRFQFDIDLDTGETHGRVYFSRSNDAPHKGGWFECDLVIVGTGVTPEGDVTSEYSGECVGRGNVS